MRPCREILDSERDSLSRSVVTGRADALRVAVGRDRQSPRMGDENERQTIKKPFLCHAVGKVRAVPFHGSDVSSPNRLPGKESARHSGNRRVRG